MTTRRISLIVRLLSLIPRVAFFFARGGENAVTHTKWLVPLDYVGLGKMI
jgi:hypothetical protein